MNEKLINPGYSNQFFEWSPNPTRFSPVTEITGQVEDKGLNFDFDPHGVVGHFKVNVKIAYRQVGNNDNLVLDAVKFEREYRIVRPTPITKNDLKTLVEYCIGEMNKDINDLPIEKKTKYLPNEFLNPDWSDSGKGWDNVVDRINKAYTLLHQQA
jgi:hypothetical protein